MRIEIDYDMALEAIDYLMLEKKDVNMYVFAKFNEAMENGGFDNWFYDNEFEDFDKVIDFFKQGARLEYDLFSEWVEKLEDIKKNYADHCIRDCEDCYGEGGDCEMCEGNGEYQHDHVAVSPDEWKEAEFYYLGYDEDLLIAAVEIALLENKEADDLVNLFKLKTMFKA